MFSLIRRRETANFSLSLRRDCFLDGSVHVLTNSAKRNCFVESVHVVSDNRKGDWFVKSVLVLFDFETRLVC